MGRGRPLVPIVAVLLLALGWSGQLAAAAPSSQTAVADASSFSATDQSASFSTPEDAIREYLAGVADADVEMILRAAAITEVSEGFRFDLLTDRIRSFIPSTTLAPAEYPLFVELNKATRTSQVLGQVRNLVYGLLSDVEIDGIPVTDVDKAWADSFVRQVDPSRLSSLSVLDIRFPDAEFADDTRYLANAAKQASMFSADEQTERLVLFSFDGRLYDVGFTLLRFGDHWKVSSQNAPLGGAPASGTARPTTVEEYDRQTRGE